MPTAKAHGLQVMKTCEAFAAQGVNVTLVLPRRHNPMTEDPFVYYSVKRNFEIKKIFSLDVGWLPERLRFYLQIFSFAFHALIRANEPRCYSRDPVVLFVFCLFGRHPIAEIHDYRSPHPRWWMRYILKKSRRVIANSEGTKSLLASHYSLATSATVAHNAVDPDFFNIPETREQAREKLGLPQDKIIIGYVGRLEVVGQSKGVPMLQEAFELMQERDNVELLLVTSVPYREVPLYLRAIDIAVLPFPDAQHAKTTSPIKLYEYMAARKTIVAADSPDVHALAHKLDAAILNPQPFAGQVPSWDERAKNILTYIS